MPRGAHHLRVQREQFALPLRHGARGLRQRRAAKARQHRVLTRETAQRLVSHQRLELCRCMIEPLQRGGAGGVTRMHRAQQRQQVWQVIECLAQVAQQFGDVAEACVGGQRQPVAHTLRELLQRLARTGFGARRGDRVDGLAQVRDQFARACARLQALLEFAKRAQEGLHLAHAVAAAAVGIGRCQRGACGMLGGQRFQHLAVARVDGVLAKVIAALQFAAQAPPCWLQPARE
ncbi:hypothetical protein D9M72_305100 [compost metagenome]